MKYIGMTVLVLAATQSAFATRFASKIHSFDFGKANESHLVRFDNSRVSFLDPKDQKLLKSLMMSRERRENVEVQVDKNNNLVAAQSAPQLKTDDKEEGDFCQKSDPYRPTIVRNTNSALSIFRNMRRDYKTSGECFNRAHIWTYEEYEDSGSNLMKIFMFFTERYIRRYKFGWWFHVTPMVYVGSENSPRTLDRRYTTGPRQTKAWSDIFIRSKRRCQVVKTFNEFFENQNVQDCYHIYTSMYYVQPRDIEKRDLSGVEKTEFNERELLRAYKNAFKYDPN